MRISLRLGDIVDEDVDAVVNAANSGLLGGGGVDGAILRAGGDRQLAARRELRDRIGSLPAGQAAATDAGDMLCRWIIHVVGPVYSQTDDRSDLAAQIAKRERGSPPVQERGYEHDEEQFWRDRQARQSGYQRHEQSACDEERRVRQLDAIRNHPQNG